MPGGRISGYTHGQHPSWGDRTHPGVDVGGPEPGLGCGLPVFAAAEGEVKGVLAYGDGHLDPLGNALLLQHAPQQGRPVLTLYLHLQSRPDFSVGAPVVAGQQIGRMGDTGAGTGCHLHFEVRHFESWLFSEWSNIYGTGDWSERPEFLSAWSEPGEWFDQLYTSADAAAEFGDVRLGEHEGYASDLFGTYQLQELLVGMPFGDLGFPYCFTFEEPPPMEITGLNIHFYEPTCVFRTPLSPGQTRYDGMITCSGEGQTWEEPVGLILEGARLLRRSRGEDFIYQRCEPVHPE